MNDEAVLPKAYAPFAPVLELLSRPLAQVLRGQLAQFEPLARGLEQREFALQGDFEGLGGLTHHGAIDHILQSELLLRTEAPLEFLRRLAESETLFHDRIFADPGARQIWRVVVSTGPDMLGHGRLVTLAALFFLARVAARRDAALHWCFVPRAEGAVWFTGLSVNAIKRFLRSAAFREANPDDLAQARDTWADSTGESHGAKPPELVDWMIGSARDWGGDAPAITAQRNALSFVLDPPIRDEPRRAAITIRRRGHSLHRAAITLAPDRDCLAALDKPFPAPKPDRAAPQTGGSVPDMPGWEPQYLSAPAGNYRAVRTTGGLLVMKVDVSGQNEGTWFLNLPDGFLLCGIAIQQDCLCVLHHQTCDGEQRLVYHRFNLVPGEDHRASPIFEHAVPSQHLFHKRTAFALPGLVVKAGTVGFHSTSGQSYQLQVRGGGASRAWQFSTEYDAPRVLFSNGADRVAGLVQDEQAVMQVFRRNESRPATVRMHGCSALPERFHGITWSADQTSLAYAVQAGQWYILGNETWRDRLGAENVAFRPEPCERVLAAGTRRDHIQAVVWSDAALGGSGMIESLRFTKGKRVRESAPIDLGKDANRIAAIQRINGQFWAVACDQQGAPQDLIEYRRKRNRGGTQVVYYPLAQFRDAAAQLQFGDGPQ